jgi:anti-sigma factor RsiW
VTDEHLSLDELAEFDEGLLPADRASEVQAHLDGCAECRARAESIAATRQLLANLPEVEMPAEVKARLDRAIAEDSSGTATVVPQLDNYRRRRFGRPTWAASAAASVLLLAFGAIIVGLLLHNPATSSGGGAGGSAAPEQRAASQPSTYVRTSTGLDYTPTSLLAQVPSLVANVANVAHGGAATSSTPAGTTAISPVASPAAPSPKAITLRRSPVAPALRALYNSRAKLLACAATLNGHGAIPITVDFGRWTFESFRKAPAAIFVFRDPDPSVVDVFVVGPSCSTASVRTYVKVPLQQ